MKDAFLRSEPAVEMTSLNSSSSSALNTVLMEAKHTIDNLLTQSYQSVLPQNTVFTEAKHSIDTTLLTEPHINIPISIFRPDLWTLTDLLRPAKKFNNPNPDNIRTVNALASVLWICVSGYLDTRSLVSAFYSCKELGLMANSNIIRKRLIEDKQQYESERLMRDHLNPLDFSARIRLFRDTGFFVTKRPAALVPEAKEEKEEKEAEFHNYNDSDDGQGFVMIGRPK